MTHTLSDLIKLREQYIAIILGHVQLKTMDTPKCKKAIERRDKVTNAINEYVDRSL